ncbi:MAG: aminotransferase class V-fold PLP-dependent enzyme [Rubrivivax sp.]|nr:aminotransferase class V-fold PLP-dependent enzyme [Rubrivivax sp.]
MREHFLLDPGTVFLNHGSYGACPKPVFAEFQRWQLEMERNPVDFLGRRSGALLAAARARLAEYLGADAADLVFVSNATTGVNTVAQSLALQPGDEVLATDHEYGACDATWRAACTRAGARYRRVEIPLPFDSDGFVDRMMAAVTPRTKLVFASHVTSTTALIFPVAALCTAARERGITTLIDGAHAPGQLPLDLAAVGADYYTGNCHKWLCAPKGAAFLHVRREHQAGIAAPVVSWGYVAELMAGEQHDTAAFDAFTGHGLLQRRLQWQGTRDIAAFLAVPAAIDFQQQHDWPSWQRRCHALACATRARVAQHNGLPAAAPDAAFAQMVVIPVATADPAALQRRLFQQHRIEVPMTQHGRQRFVRVSVQAYNTEAELDALVLALCPPAGPATAA